MQMALYILVLALLGLIAVQLAVARAFRARVLGLAGRLVSHYPAIDPGATAARAAGLPALVANYAARAGAEPGAALRSVRFNQRVEMRLAPGGPFVAMRAWQVMALGRAGFLWEARRDLGPLTRLRVLDAWVEGEGHLEARILGSIPVTRAGGAGIALGDAYRYLAELPWAPDAMIGNPDLVWRQTGPARAEVRLQTAQGTAYAVFDFDAEGDIVAVSASGRPVRGADGRIAPRDWHGTFGDYARLGSRRLPGRVEVGYDGDIWFRAEVADYRISG